MGAGHWNFRHTEFATGNYHIEARSRDYEAERDAALDQIKAHLAEHPEVFAPFEGSIDQDEIDLQWCFDNLEELIGELGLHDLNCGLEEFAQDDQDQLYGLLTENLGAIMDNDSGITSCDKQAETLDHGYNSGFKVIGEGRFVEIGLRSWEHSLYVGIHPKFALQNYESAINGKSFDPSTSKTEGSDPALFLKIQRAIATAALVVEPENADYKALALQTTRQPDLDDVFGPDLPAYRRNANYVPESLTKYAEELLESGDASRFEELFGISADDFAGNNAIVELITAVHDEVGHLPETIVRGYQAEFDKTLPLVLEALHNTTSEVYEPTSAWTSKKVEYTPAQPEQKHQEATAAAPEAPAGPGM